MEKAAVLEERVRAEFVRLSEPDRKAGTATWTGGDVRLDAPDDDGMERLRRVFRSTPVSVDDASLRTAGTAGPVLLQPGTIEWFQAVARVRSARWGLGVRYVADDASAMGWDPAGAYRSFASTVDRLARGTATEAAGHSEGRAGA